MSKVLLNTANDILADVLKRQLKGNDFQIDVCNKAESLLNDFSKSFYRIVLMDINETKSWSLEERVEQIKALKRKDHETKVVVLIDDKNNAKLTEGVLNLKTIGLIDGFVYTSVSGNYFLGLMKTL